MQQRSKNEDGRPCRRHRAAGQKVNLAIFLVVVIIGYVAWVLMTPRLTAYQLEGSIQPVCRTFMYAYFARDAKRSDRALDWKRDWEQRSRGLGVQLREDQWQFTISDTCTKKGGCTCTGEAVFELSTPWFGLDEVIEIPPYKSTHHVIKNVEWQTSY